MLHFFIVLGNGTKIMIQKKSHFKINIILKINSVINYIWKTLTSTRGLTNIFLFNEMQTLNNTTYQVEFFRYNYLIIYSFSKFYVNILCSKNTIKQFFCFLTCILFNFTTTF